MILSKTVECTNKKTINESWNFISYKTIKVAPKLFKDTCIRRYNDVLSMSINMVKKQIHLLYLYVIW